MGMEISFLTMGRNQGKWELLPLLAHPENPEHLHTLSLRDSFHSVPLPQATSKPRVLFCLLFDGIGMDVNIPTKNRSFC